MLEILAGYPGHVTVSCIQVHRVIVRGAGRHLAAIERRRPAVTLDQRPDARPEFHVKPPCALLDEWRGEGPPRDC